MARIYMERLIKTVIELSHGNDWDTAVVEWEIIDCEEDSTLSESCICGKEHLFYLFTIKNIITGSTLFPIGSSCIKKFGRDDLNDEASVREKMFKLYHAVENNQFISLSPEFFSRKLLKKLFEDGAFDCEYNDYDGLDDYEFIVKMFNKRDKSSITFGQQKKIRARCRRCTSRRHRWTGRSPAAFAGRCNRRTRRQMCAGARSPVQFRSQDQPPSQARADM